MEKLSMQSRLQLEAPTQVSPADFDEFLPWAAEKLFLPFTIVVTRKTQEAPPTPLSGYKVKKGAAAKSGSKMNNVADKDSELKSIFSDEMNRDVVKITTIYDKDDLIQILIDKPKQVFREVIILITQIIEFHHMLRRITINRGIDQYVIYELNHLLRVSNITEVYLDGTFVIQANYALLLTEANNLQVLSLARCNLQDRVVQEIADKLHYPLPACHKLIMLNLSTNFLTNKSAKYLATALRTNRKLSYLNLSGNKISDEGGIAILNALTSFPLTLEEVTSFKQRHVDYLKNRDNLIKLQLENLKLQDATSERKTFRKDKKAAISPKRNKEDDDKNMEATLYEKAENLAIRTLGYFDDPVSDSTIINEWRYSNGNGSIVYLNLAYNNLTYAFLKTLLKVLQYQHANKIKGLKNVQLDGNPLPAYCMEMSLLDSYFDIGLSYAAHRGSVHRGRNATKAKK